MAHLVLAVRLRIATRPEAARGAAPPAKLEPGSDVVASRYASWVEPSRELRVAGVAGAELVIDEAIVILVERPLAAGSLVATRQAGPAPRVVLEAKHNGETVGRIDVETAGSLPLGPLLEGDVVSLGVRLTVPMDAPAGASRVDLIFEAA